MIDIISYMMGCEKGKETVELGSNDYIFRDEAEGDIVITEKEENE